MSVTSRGSRIGALILGLALLGCSSAHIKRTETGYASYYEGDLDQAEEDFQSALSKSSDFEPALTGLGLVAYDRGEYDKSRESFDKAVAADRTADALYGRGKTLLRLFQWSAARDDLRAAAAADLGEANLELGMAHMLLGEGGQALEAIKAYSAVSGATPERKLVAVQVAYRVGIREELAADALKVVEAYSFAGDAPQAPEFARIQIDLAAAANDYSAAMRVARSAPTALDFGFIYRELSPVASRTFQGLGGAVVDLVHLGTPAERADLHPGDIITGFNAVPVTSGVQLSELIATFQAQSQQQKIALLEVLREDTYYAAYMELGKFDFDGRLRASRDEGKALNLSVAPDDLALWP